MEINQEWENETPRVSPKQMASAVVLAKVLPGVLIKGGGANMTSEALLGSLGCCEAASLQIHK